MAAAEPAPAAPPTFDGDAAQPQPAASGLDEAPADRTARLVLDASGNPIPTGVADAYLEALIDDLELSSADAAALRSALFHTTGLVGVAELFAEPARDRFARTGEFVDDTIRERHSGTGADPRPALIDAWAAAGDRLRVATFWCASALHRAAAVDQARIDTGNTLYEPFPGATAEQLDTILDAVAAFATDRALGAAFADGDDPFGSDWPDHYARLLDQLSMTAGDDRGLVRLAAAFNLQSAPGPEAWQTARALRDQVREWAARYWRPDPGARPEFTTAFAALSETGQARLLAAAPAPATVSALYSTVKEYEAATGLETDDDPNQLGHAMLPGESDPPLTAADLQADADVGATATLVDRLNTYLDQAGWERRDWPDDLETHWTNEFDQTVIVPYAFADDVEQRCLEAIEGIAEAEDRSAAEVEADLDQLNASAPGQAEPDPPAAPPEPESDAETPSGAAPETDPNDTGAAPAPTFRPAGQGDLGQTGSAAVRARANIAALRTLRQLQAEGRPATAEEQAVLAKWSGWGAASQVFDESRDQFADLRAELSELLSGEEYRAARASTLNAHYTDAAYVQAIWDAVGDLGFTGGEVLEPGCGSGNFIGFAPEGARMTGVELDPTTASIAGLLYPDADILPASFAKIDAARDAFDLTVGNVPFHDSTIHDPAFNPHGFSTHNYFISKSIQLTRPGGLVAVVTSSFTMDAVSPAVRREIAAAADLVGAVRLPNRAHRSAAGTDALTDVLVFRRREPDAEPAPGTETWELTEPVREDGTGPRINSYFTAHPECVLGEVGLETNMHASESVTVTGETDPAAVASGLRSALARIVDTARESGLVMTERAEAAPAPAAAVATHTETPPERFIRETAPGSGEFQMWAGGDWQPHPVPKNQVRELRELLGLRDTVVALLAAEAATIDDTDEITGLRAVLNEQYDAYTDRFGPINRVKVSTRTTVDPDTGERVPLVDEDTGQPKTTQRAPGQGGFRGDAHAFLVKALEHYNLATGEAAKSSIFTERVLTMDVPALGAETPADALAICLDRTGGVDLATIADLLGIGEAEARDALGELVFDDPETGKLVTAAEYCSGDIRTKLDAARDAAQSNPAMAGNVAALEAACPPDLTPGEITPRMGAVWIPAADVQAFLRELLEDPRLVVEYAGGATWAVNEARKGGMLATNQWGTQRMPAPTIAYHLLTGKPIRIEDRFKDAEGREKTALNQSATDAANTKAEAMAERFRAWVWEDAERTDRLVDAYNRRFNSHVPRNYDGKHLSLPGLSKFYKLFDHQLAAVDRMIHEPSVGLFHEVGAGKTLEMIVGTMELKRLGLASKPAIIVPNHMLEQFSREFLDAYPQANILAASTDDLARNKRREFIGRIATGNWDCVIFTHSAFAKIGMSHDSQVAYFEAERGLLEAKLEAAAGQRTTVKEIEGSIKRINATIEKLQESAKSANVDTDLTFEMTGIDYLSVDEAHLFKNLRRASVIDSMTIAGSNRASDLHMKLEYLRSRGRGHVACFATATPLPNSMGEAHTMLKYLRPDLLAEQGTLEFDAWANTFGETVTAVEIAPEGGTRAKTRFARFRNVPELMRTFHIVGDIKLAADLGLDVPDIAARPEDGKHEPEIVAIAPSEALENYMDHLMRRAEAVRRGGVRPSEDNMLKISGDGRAAAADVRLRSMDSDGEPQKADVAADKIVEIWEADRETVYTDPTTGEPHPKPGGLQLVFCDMGTPGGKNDWNLYAQLRTNLAARGMDPARVRFIHEAKNDKEKGQLFAAARAGEIDVLIGSTEKMGVGTNVQARVTAMHHLDCPWRPADVVQREGRGIRQGNQNDQVRILRYVITGSFDAYMWQTVSRKAQFISQVMRGDMGVREIEDIDEAGLSYDEIKAIASGDPRILDHANAAADVAKLEAAERGHQQSLRALHRTIADNRAEITTQRQIAGAIAEAIPQVTDTTGEAFNVTIAGAYFTEFTAATEAFRAELHKLQSANLPSGTERRIGTFGGFPIAASITGDLCYFHFDGVPYTGHQIRVETFGTASPLTKLRNSLNSLEESHETVLGKIDELERDIELAEGRLDAPFPKAAELEAARARFAELDAELAGAGPADAKPAAPTPLPPGAIRLNYDTANGYLAATGVTPGWLADAYDQVTSALDQAGFEPVGDEDEGHWQLRLAPDARSGGDRAATGPRFEEQFGVPVQVCEDGRAVYQTPEPEPEPEPEQAADAPPGALRLAFTTGAERDRQVLTGVSAQHLGKDAIAMVGLGTALDQAGFAPVDVGAGVWERRGHLDTTAERAEAVRQLQAAVDVPIQVTVNGEVRTFAPDPATAPVPAEVLLPKGHLRLDLAADREIVTGASPSRLGYDHSRIAEGLREAGFAPVGPDDSDRWERPSVLTPPSSDDQARALSQSVAARLEAPVQLHVDGQARWFSSADHPPKGVVRLTFDSQSKQPGIYLAGVSEESLGAERMEHVRSWIGRTFATGSDSGQFGLFGDFDALDDDARAAQGPAFEQLLGGPVQLRNNDRAVYETPGTTRFTADEGPDAAWRSHQAPTVQDRFVRADYDHAANTITVSGVTPKNLGPARWREVIDMLERHGYRPGAVDGAWMLSTKRLAQVDDTARAAQGPKSEQQLGGPVELYNDGRLVFQSEPPAAAPDGSAAARSAAAALGAARATAPVSPATPAQAPQPESDRAR